MSYAGGSTYNPTYRNLADHSEAIQIDYDPVKISYEELLGIFLKSHDPTVAARSRQYMSAIFYHDEEQGAAALTAIQAEERQLDRKIVTEIIPYSEFFLAEDYHQKYYLQQNATLMAEFTSVYHHMGKIVNSTAAARINGYMGGNGSLKQLNDQLDMLGLSPGSAERLMQIGNKVLP